MRSRKGKEKNIAVLLGSGRSSFRRRAERKLFLFSLFFSFMGHFFRQNGTFLVIITQNVPFLKKVFNTFLLGSGRSSFRRRAERKHFLFSLFFSFMGHFFRQNGTFRVIITQNVPFLKIVFNTSLFYFATQ